MNLNATLIGQMIAFLLFVLATWRWVLPPIMKALNERRETIAKGLEAADAGKKALELANHQAAGILRDAKAQTASILDKANQRAHRIVEDAKEDARQEGARIVAAAKAEIEQETAQAKEVLRLQLVDIALAGTEKILERSIDQAANKELLDKLVKEF
ncbi:F0F1 ATP synthase subunit B [Piscirickettsia litoralis]|uniref:ATP synthase subunit b n=1 Tax=Piscirickettsia litoralis TaxID=1891921 RepID=A0ABX3A6C2_9GAMM|nr:F0F1 ATP synthase subunit B [Piscirickettsia litoralis]ODN43040.1 F0F1 ATP synthase subunit B [Piscirickettsia litoralis]